MLKPGIAVAGGVLIGLLIVWLTGAVGLFVFPPPPDLDIADAAARKVFMDRAPLGSVLALMLSWPIGAFVGAWAAVRFSELDEAWPAWAAGAVVVLALVLGMIRMPHPIWFVVVTILLTAGAAWLAGRLATPFDSAPDAPWEDEEAA